MRFALTFPCQQSTGLLELDRGPHGEVSITRRCRQGLSYLWWYVSTAFRLSQGQLESDRAAFFLQVSVTQSQTVPSLRTHNDDRSQAIPGRGQGDTSRYTCSRSSRPIVALFCRIISGNRMISYLDGSDKGVVRQRSEAHWSP
jgi:hypothetical protein